MSFLMKLREFGFKFTSLFCFVLFCSGVVFLQCSVFSVQCSVFSVHWVEFCSVQLSSFVSTSANPFTDFFVE